MATEVFNRIGEEEIYAENPNFYNNKKRQYEDDDNEPEVKVESTSKPLTEAKKEFLEHLEKDSLTVDTCEKLTHDWGN
jgi:hypothetical protein